MAEREVLSLDESTPQILAPQSGDTYLMPRDVRVAGVVAAGAGTLTTDKKVLDLSATWNSAGTTFTGIKLNATDTASASGSKLIDLQVGAASQFAVDKSSATGVTCARLQASNRIDATNLIAVSSGANITPTTYGLGVSGTMDTILTRDAADTLAQRRSTNVQTFRLYRTFTDASNLAYTAAKQDATTGYILDSVNAGTGTEPTNLLDLQLNGSSKVVATKAGALTASDSVTASAGNLSVANDTGALRFGSSADVRLTRDAANTLAQRNSTNAQTFRVYNTFTDASNYERGFVRWNANVLEIGAEIAGTGTARDVKIQAPTSKGIVFSVGSINTATIVSDRCQFDNAAFFGFVDIRIYRAAANILNFGGTSTTTGSAFQMQEMTAPAAPATNGVRIYAEDNGAGKTRLMALFATGAAQQIAIEP